ncbi:MULTISPECIES: hypothetical protein [unclassified Vibrio]|uniref:Uncharacterized protein n=1 Tax=Vibrio sp. HB236076 TaxID=3232307 RepID=A0AB39HGJ8_9VIBR|nr:hypothetical protein [Vibrio sp. HB161653]MDP5254843.1 hypothetical protein [Vibrio sp. HB161653]
MTQIGLNEKKLVNASFLPLIVIQSIELSSAHEVEPRWDNLSTRLD